MKIVIVKWIDSANHTIGWQDSSKSIPATIKSVGFISHQNKKCITLVQSFCAKGPGKGSVNNAITIPRGCIQSIAKLN